MPGQKMQYRVVAAADDAGVDGLTAAVEGEVMWCLTVKTRCRLCGGSFEEGICAEDRGIAWKRHEGHPLEDGAPWCRPCMERINETCEALCLNVTLEELTDG